MHSYCELITDYLKNDLLNEGYFYEEYIPDQQSIVKLLKISDRAYNSSLIICSPLNLKTIILLIFVLFMKPSKLIYVIPPSNIHNTYSFLFKLKKYLFKTILTLMSTVGVKQLLIFTTPYERIILENIVRKTSFIYYPTYCSEKPLLSGLSIFDKQVILYSINSIDDVFLANSMLSVLEELGLKPLLIMNLLNRNITKCTGNYRVLCIHTYDYDELIKNTSLIIVKTPSPVSNEVILKSIVYGKPVVAAPELGLALYYSDSEFVYLNKTWSSETLARSILDILSNIDYLKKKSLSTSISTLSNKYGRYVLLKFIRE